MEQNWREILPYLLTRTRNTLKNEFYDMNWTIREFGHYVKTNTASLLRMPNFGQKSLEDILAALAQFEEQESNKQSLSEIARSINNLTFSQTLELGHELRRSGLSADPLHIASAVSRWAGEN